MLDTQLDSLTYNSTNPKVIDAIVMKSSQKLFAYESSEYGNQLTQAMNRTDYGADINPTMRVIIHDDSPETEGQIDALKTRNDLALITKKKGKGGKWKMIGWETGMRLVNVTSDSNDADLKSAYVLEFTAEGESTPLTLIHKTTGVEDTDTYLETLLAADPA